MSTLGAIHPATAMFHALEVAAGRHAYLPLHNASPRRSLASGYNRASRRRDGTEIGLRGKVVMVSGASKGIGRAVAEKFAAEGASLALCARGAGVQPIENYMIGGAANAALLNFTKALADEGAPHGILVTGVNHGPIRTERWDGIIVKWGAAKGISTLMADPHFCNDTEDAKRRSEP